MSETTGSQKPKSRQAVASRATIAAQISPASGNAHIHTPSSG